LEFGSKKEENGTKKAVDLFIGDFGFITEWYLSSGDR
jgi:hypothetical protein